MLVIGDKVVRNPNSWVSGDEDHHNGKPSVGILLDYVPNFKGLVKWESGTIRCYHHKYLSLYEEITTEEIPMKKGVVNNVDIGAKVVRNPEKWHFGTQDYYKGKPSFGVIVESISPQVIRVKWRSDRIYSYMLSDKVLLYYEEEQTPSQETSLCEETTKDTETITKVDIKGKKLIVPEIKSTIKSGKLPIGKPLQGKIKTTKIVKSNIKFKALTS